MRLFSLSLIAALLLPLSAGLCAEVTATPRVALVYSDYGDFRHRDDYDYKMNDLGWSMDKYENTEFGQLVEKLDHYDIVLGTALFNYSNTQDFSQYKEQLLDFMNRGGAIVWTDTNYPEHVNWLQGFGPGWAVSAQPAPQTGTPVGWMDESHPIFNLPNEVRKTRGTWAHMHPAEDWDILSKSQDEEPTGLFRRHGHGFMMLTCYWNHDSDLLENIWATLQAYRGGLIPTLPDYTDFDLGSNEAQMKIENVTDTHKEFQAVAKITGPHGEVTEHAVSAEVQPGQTRTVTLEIPLHRRGDHHVRTTFLADGNAFYSYVYDGPRIPDLLTIGIVRPHYRGSVYTAAAPQNLEFAIDLHPHEYEIDDLSLAARLRQGEQELGRQVRRHLSSPNILMSMPLQLTGDDADIHLEVRLVEKGVGRDIGTATKPVAVVPAQDNQVFIGPDLETRVEGELYFPIGIYHVGVENLAQAKELGFNCFQGWGTTPSRAKSVLDAGHKYGMKCILEMSAFLRGDEFNRKGLAAMVNNFADHPALLAWYTVDEPYGEQGRTRCIQAHNDIMKSDPHHPVYLVMCRPGDFDNFAKSTDILAIDPYPIPGSVTLVSDWMQRAQEAVEHRKPIWMIPQLHNTRAYRDPDQGRGPTPAEERNMVYQGLIWGAKGIVYYPWDDGPCGLVHDEALMKAVKEINAELAILGPRLLSCTRTVTAQNDEQHPDLYAAVFENGEEIYVIAVNVAEETRDLAVPVPGLADGSVEVIFENRQSRVADEQITDNFAPLAVHVYHRG